MKKFFPCMIAAFFALIVSAETPAQAKFNATVSQVDVGGEMLQYQDNRPATEFFNNTLPAIFRVIFANEPFAPTANNAVESVVRLLNIGAFKAFAQSSVQVAPDTYVYKIFTLTDMKAKSILIDPSMTNAPVDLTILPADTRIAFKTRVNFGHIFDMVYAELKNSTDPRFQEIAAGIDQFKQSGFDLRQMCASVDGDIEILVTGTTLADAGIKVSIPDKNGSISLILKRMIPPADGDIDARIPSPIGEIIVLYQDGRITATNQPRLLEAPAATLASVAGYSNLLKYIPADGCGYFLLDIPQEVIAQVRTALEDTPFVSIFDMLIKPCRAISVFQVKDNGYYSVTASDFSFYQLAQCIQTGALAVPALIALPALEEARERAAVTKCFNNMREISTVILMYCNDHDATFPDSLSQLQEYHLSDEQITCGVIYFGSPVKLTQIRNASSMPIAICPVENTDNAVVIFADGHAETITVENGKNIIDILAENYSLDQKTVNYITRKFNENQ